MRYLLKLLKKGFGLFLFGPLIGFYTLLSKHWLLNSLLGAFCTFLLAGKLLPLLPTLLTFTVGYALSAAAIGLVQQGVAFIRNFRLGQCEMMCAPLVPEISYATFSGMRAANYVAVKAEFAYQNKDISNVTEEDFFYAEKTMAFLLYSAGHFRCAEKGCWPLTWDMKESESRGFSFR